MRAALISLAETITGDPASARAFIRLGGSPLAEHQAAQALGAGVRRIILYSEEISGQMLSLQRQIEDAGLDVRVLRSPEGLTAQLASVDQLLLFGEGFQAHQGIFDQLLPRRADGQLEPAIATIPADPGLADRFERLDINHLWAGLALIPSTVLDKLPEIPGDWNLVSALLRIASQQGLAMHPVSADLVTRGELEMLRDDEDADLLEPQWLKAQMGETDAIGPGDRLKRWLAQKSGPVLLHDGHSAVPLVIGAMSFTALSLVAAWLDVPAVGMVMAGMAWLVGGTAELVERLDKGRIRSTPRLTRLCTRQTVNAIVDAALVVIAALAMGWGQRSGAGAGWYAAMTIPLLTVGIIRLSSGHFAHKVAPVAAGLLGDRLVWSLLMAGALMLDAFEAALMLGSLLLVIWWLAVDFRSAVRRNSAINS